MLDTLRVQGSDSARSALVLLHGLSSCAENWRASARALKLPDDVAIILPQAPSRAVTLAGGVTMPAWFDVYAHGEDAREDEAGIAVMQREIQTLIDSLNVPPRNVVIGGFSQGGALALHYACHAPETFAGVVALSAYLPLHRHFAQAPLQKIPVFISHGEEDDVIPLHYAETTRNVLEQHGFPVNWRTYPLGHFLDAHVIKDLAAWLKKRLAV